MNDSPLVSIIIPVYNTPKKYLLACLNSVKKQDYDDLEVIVVDDGSDKNTAELVDDFVSRTTEGIPEQKWQVIHRENGGLSAARNTGYKIATGKYIQFLDSDDYFDYKLISSAVNIAEQTNAEIIIENFELYDTKTSSRKPALLPNSFPDRMPFSLVDLNVSKIGVIPYSSWSKLFKKDFLDSNDIKHDESLYRSEDVLFSCSALVLANRISLLPDPLITYLENLPSSNSETNDKFPLDSVRAWQKLYDFLHERGLYESYKKDFESAMLWSVCWHIKRLHTTEDIKELGVAAQKFIYDINLAVQNDQTVAIALASVSPSALRLLEDREGQLQSLYRRLSDLEEKLNSTNAELEALRKPAIKQATRKLAGAIKRRLVH